MKILQKLTNTKTVLSIVSLMVLILVNLGVDFDSEKVELIANAVCGILVLLGIMNSDGMTTNSWDK